MNHRPRFSRSPHRRLTAGLAGLLSIATVLTTALAVDEPAGASTSKARFGNVRTHYGVVKGITTTSGYRWLGLPFAAPPVGALRWHAPVAPATWKGVRNATRFGNACLQSATDYDDHRGSENCLYLNVYAPAGTRPASRLPVMVWLHGGGFVNGSGNDFDGSRLASTAHALVVTVNYRLGPFGWLALQSLTNAQHSPSGDYGLMDQVAALKWVKSNIAGFGGNSKLVTLFGQSAGGESTLAQVASPQAKGLFQRAIVHSAPAGLVLPTVTAASQRNQSAYASELGCTNVTTQVACLRAVPAAKALAAGHESFDLIKELGLYWTPTVGSPSLPGQWLALYKAGKYNHMPIMIGHTKNEGRLFTAIYENNNGHAITLGEEIERGTKFFSAAAPAILAAYNPVQYPTPGIATSAVITDAMFACGDNRDRDALTTSGERNVYGFQFADPNAFNVEVRGKFTRVEDGHDSDLPFLFQYNHGRLGPKNPPFTAAQRTIAIQMGRYWGNFARTGNPNGTGLPAWPRYIAGTTTPTQSLQPGGAVTLPTGNYYNAHQCGLWYPLLDLKDSV